MEAIRRWWRDFNGLHVEWETKDGTFKEWRGAKAIVALIMLVLCVYAALAVFAVAVQYPWLLALAVGVWVYRRQRRKEAT